jgi:hypothetical protein
MGTAMAKPTDWAALTARAAWTTVAVYVVLGIFAWIQVLQARRLREEQARPFVIVDFEPGFLVYLKRFASCGDVVGSVLAGWAA